MGELVRLKRYFHNEKRVSLTLLRDTSVLCTLGLVQELLWDQGGGLSTLASLVCVAHAGGSLMIVSALAFVILQNTQLIWLFLQRVNVCLSIVFWLITCWRGHVFAWNPMNLLHVNFPALNRLHVLRDLSLLVVRHSRRRAIWDIIVPGCRSIEVHDYVILDCRLICRAKMLGGACSTSLGCLAGCCLSTEHKIQRSGLAIGYLLPIFVLGREGWRSKLSMLSALVQLLAHITIWNIRLIIWIDWNLRIWH